MHPTAALVLRKPKQKSYDVSFKLLAVSYMEKETNKATAAGEFGDGVCQRANDAIMVPVQALHVLHNNRGWPPNRGRVKNRGWPPNRGQVKNVRKEIDLEDWTSIRGNTVYMQYTYMYTCTCIYVQTLHVVGIEE